MYINQETNIYQIMDEKAVIKIINQFHRLVLNRTKKDGQLI
jgi:hypothetical protein